MSAGFASAVAEGLRHNGVPVTFEPGYLTRGNGFTFPHGRPDGCLIHHTGSDYDTGLSVLLKGRADLSPPLCNSCGYGDGRVHIIAAHPGNHAGASGGRSMGPLPVTRLFNPRVWGHEIMYPGARPMTAAQERSALILGGVICGILGRPSVEWVRLHHETSVTGKWDAGAGIGPGNALDGDLFRSKIWGALTTAPPDQTGADDMPAGIIRADEPETLELPPIPVGRASGLVHTGWLSLSLSAGGRIDAEAYDGKGASMDRWGRVVAPHERMWREVPDGAQAYSATITPRGPGTLGWAFELRPRKDIAR